MAKAFTVELGPEARNRERERILGCVLMFVLSVTLSARSHEGRTFQRRKSCFECPFPGTRVYLRLLLANPGLEGKRYAEFLAFVSTCETAIRRQIAPLEHLAASFFFFFEMMANVLPLCF